MVLKENPKLAATKVKAMYIVDEEVTEPLYSEESFFSTRDGVKISRGVKQVFIKTIYIMEEGNFRFDGRVVTQNQIIEINKEPLDYDYLVERFGFFNETLKTRIKNIFMRSIWF